MTPNEEKAILAKISKAKTLEELKTFEAEGNPQSVIDAITTKAEGLTAEAAGNDVDSACVRMTKEDCEGINVHPSQIALWKSQGWTVVE